MIPMLLRRYLAKRDRAGANLNPVARLQRMLLDSFAIDISAVRAAQIENSESLGTACYLGVAA